MSVLPVIAIFDIGKTNKKIFLFDKKYNIVFEESITLKETIDEDGDACENLAMLTEWVKDTFKKIMLLPGFKIRAINFTAYGASLVHLMEEGMPLLPLCNYLKQYPSQLQNELYATYGGKIKIEKETASPASGNLNSGLQLYRIKKQYPYLFKKIRRSLHLPQYISFLITHKEFSDITSIGCHTALWNFKTGTYHQWVFDEGIDKKMAPIEKVNKVIEVNHLSIKIIAGIGLHDSSAALLPYLLNFIEPFVLISTGTWCISLNPFNDQPLTEKDLNNECLCYLQYQGQPVKANRLFAGYEHEQLVKKLALHFSKPSDYFKQVHYDELIIKKLRDNTFYSNKLESIADFKIAMFNSYEEAYHYLLIKIVDRQVLSTTTILTGTAVKRIFIDGGFSKNTIYMNLMAQFFTSMEVFAASMAQGTAIGAALAIHKHWNDQPIPGDIITLKMYTPPKER